MNARSVTFGRGRVDNFSVTSALAFTSQTPPTEAPADQPLPARSPDEIRDLVLSVDQMVRAYARKVVRAGVAEFDDVVQDGRVGALHAAHSWDPDVANFPTHAMHRIRGEVIDGMRRRDVVSRSIRASWDPDDVRLQQQTSLNLVVGDGGAELGTLLPADEPDPEQLVVEAAYFDWQCKEAQFAMRMLSGYERDVVRDYFWGGLTLWQIGERMGFTESRASQIRNRALLTMWRCMSTRDELVDS